jgi:hypothetical protein
LGKGHLHLHFESFFRERERVWMMISFVSRVREKCMNCFYDIFFLNRPKWNIYIYIYKYRKKVVLLAQGVPRKDTAELQIYQYKRTNEMKCSTLVDAQTKQWVRPPGMIVGNKINIRSLQPSEREHLHFFQQKRDRTGCVAEQAMVTLIPQYPDTS